MFYMLLNVIYWAQGLMSTKYLHSRLVPKHTYGCLYKVGCYCYYCCYYFSNLNRSCNVFTGIKESEKYQILRKLLQCLFSCYVIAEGRTQQI